MNNDKRNQSKRAKVHKAKNAQAKAPAAVKVAHSAVKSQPSKALHQRNLHNNGYDFPALIEVFPTLKPHIKPNPYGNLSIDFGDPLAVKMLNAALLKLHYGIQSWDIPQGFLCPPIPGRADYIHYAADLLAVKKTNKKRVPKGPRVKVLDIGTGANVIYPLLGIQSYGWSFVASDVDPISIDNAKRIFAANPQLEDRFEARLQLDAKRVFRGIINSEDRFDLTVCNPPFHSSLAEASEGTARKLKNLAANKIAKGIDKPNHSAANKLDPLLNFGGQKAELWCDGGEQAFLKMMITESGQFANQCLWFTTLVSKKENLKPAKALLKTVKAEEVKEIEMHQGNKVTRVLAWTFMGLAQRELWQKYRDVQ